MKYMLQIHGVSAEKLQAVDQYHTIYGDGNQIANYFVASTLSVLMVSCCMIPIHVEVLNKRFWNKLPQ